MTDGHPGWFKDPSDPALARWHDGDDWTEHTLVIADQTPGVEPTPPVITPPAAEEAYFPRHRSDSGDEDDDSTGGIPAWAKVVAPLVVVLVGVLGFSMLSGDDDGGDDETTTEDTQPASLSDAVDEARDAGLPSAISDARASALIERICAAARRPSNIPQLGTDLGQLPVTSASELRTSIDALGEGAEERCAEDMADEPGLIDELQDLAFVAFGTSTTAPTITGDSIPVEGGADGGDTTGTTKAGSTATTRPRTSTTQPATTTTAPATTTTENDIQQNFPCSPEGASATDKFGKPVVCRKACAGTSQRLTWQRGPCPAPPTPPTVAP